MLVAFSVRKDCRLITKAATSRRSFTLLCPLAPRLTPRSLSLHHAVAAGLLLKIGVQVQQVFLIARPLVEIKPQSDVLV